MRPDRRSVLRAAGAVTVLGLGAACARIPVDSPIDARELSGQAPPGAPYVRALPPAEGASPEAIVTGFVYAGVSQEDDFAVARQYLSGAARASWVPRAGVTVYSGSHELQVQTDGERHAVMTVQVLATVQEGGLRSILAGQVAREVEFELEETDEGWRIIAAPDGIFLSEAAFETLYAPVRLYFLDARRQHLVPDHRWLPLQLGARGVLETLARGPAAYLGDAVTTLVPPSLGAEDSLVSAGADGGVRVEVPDAVGSLPGRERELAIAQIEQSLRSLRTLSGVRLVLRGEDLAGADTPVIARALPGHRPIAAGQTGVIGLGGAGTNQGVTQLVPDLAQIELAGPVLAQDGILAAALTADASLVLVASTDGSVPLREAATGGLFVPPRIDDAGFVWTSTRASAGVLLALSGISPTLDAKVNAPWLAGRQVRALDIAADATRMLILSADAAGTRLDLCAVRRDREGVPSSLTEPLVVRTFLTEVVQASWFDEVAVIVLGDEATTGERRAQVVDFASGGDALPSLPAATTSIAGTVVADTYWAGTADGGLLRGDGEGWADIGIPGRDPSFY